MRVRGDEDPDVAEEMARALEVLRESESSGESDENDKTLAKRFSESLRSIGVESEAGEKKRGSNPPSLLTLSLRSNESRPSSAPDGEMA